MKNVYIVLLKSGPTIDVLEGKSYFLGERHTKKNVNNGIRDPFVYYQGLLLKHIEWLSRLTFSKGIIGTCFSYTKVYSVFLCNPHAGIP